MPVDEGFHLGGGLGVAHQLLREHPVPVHLVHRRAGEEEDQGRGGRAQVGEVQHHAAGGRQQGELVPRGGEVAVRAGVVLEHVDDARDDAGGARAVQETDDLLRVVQDEVLGRRIHDLDGGLLVHLGHGDEGDPGPADPDGEVGVAGEQGENQDNLLGWRHCREEIIFCQIPLR